ncbi:unnamed protein product [Caenorhabditis bovis]|uniref:Uncharacterized protein n=1 Tax=Caenorhabditis bovis TaxID=2654633 RepID=A0A8S1E9X2_9PELO|nr:unnamed protein product [Caenorhabditis bovis]
MVICKSFELANMSCTDVCTARKKVDLRVRIGVRLLGKEEEIDENEVPPADDPANPPHPRIRKNDIMFGSADDCLKFLEELEPSEELACLKEKMRYIIVENCDEIATNDSYALTVSKILLNFVNGSTTMLFFADSCKPNLDISFAFFKEIVTTNVFLEFEDATEFDIFKYIKFHFVSDDRFLNALACSPKSDAELKNFECSKKVMTVLIQKLELCNFEVDRLTLQRAQERGGGRAEKILVVTSNQKTANLVALYLKHIGRNKKIGILTKNMDRERMEYVNFQYRRNGYDIVVIDYKSMHDIGRAIVDAVILFDLPQFKYFSTFMEDEMFTLMSRNAVRLKLHVMFDENKDIFAVPKFMALDSPDQSKSDVLKIMKLVPVIGKEIKSLDPKNPHDRILVYSSRNKMCRMLAFSLGQVNLISSIFESNCLLDTREAYLKEQKDVWESGANLIAVAHSDLEKEKTLRLCRKIYLLDIIPTDLAMNLCERISKFDGNFKCTVIPIFTTFSEPQEYVNVSAIMLEELDANDGNDFEEESDGPSHKEYSNEAANAFAHMKIVMDSDCDDDDDDGLPIDPDYDEDDFPYY